MSSTDSPRYIECDDAPFIPVGLNLCFPRFFRSPEDGLETMRRFLDRLADNGGNYTRFYLGHDFFDIEPRRMGEFEVGKARLIIELLDHARKRGVYVKLTLEHFRHIVPARQAENFPGAVSFSRPNYHRSNGGAFEDLDEFLQSQAGRQHYLKKVDWLSEQLGDHPAIFAWELWNEMNSLPSPYWPAWTEYMLDELHRRFPGKRIVQSLGSLDRDAKLPFYEHVMPLPGNDIAQVHRYLDLGAPWAICQGPVDVMMADAVATLRRLAPGKPAMLGEGGAVEPRHSRPWDLYPKDRAGALLHDVLFSVFFAGSCGSGQVWHWQEYVDRNDLWWHFKRFVRAIEGVNPLFECFVPCRLDTRRLRVYALLGRETSLIWCRDAENDWRSECVDGVPPAEITGESIELSACRGGLWSGGDVCFYDPWADAWSTAVADSEVVRLPAFTRSLVIRVGR